MATIEHFSVPSKLSLIILLCSRVVALLLATGLWLSGVAVAVSVRVSDGCSLWVVLWLLDIWSAWVHSRSDLTLVTGWVCRGGGRHVALLNWMGFGSWERIVIAASTVIVVISWLVARCCWVCTHLLGSIKVSWGMVNFHYSVEEYLNKFCRKSKQTTTQRVLLVRSKAYLVLTIGGGAGSQISLSMILGGGVRGRSIILSINCCGCGLTIT